MTGGVSVLSWRARRCTVIAIRWLFAGDGKQSNDLSYKVVSSAGVFDYKPTISVSSSWVDLLTAYHGN